MKNPSVGVHALLNVSCGSTQYSSLRESKVESEPSVIEDQNHDTDNVPDQKSSGYGYVSLTDSTLKMQEESGLYLSPGGKWQSLASQGDIAVNPVQTKMNETIKPWRDKEIPLVGQHSTNEKNS